AVELLLRRVSSDAIEDDLVLPLHSVGLRRRLLFFAFQDTYRCDESQDHGPAKYAMYNLVCPCHRLAPFLLRCAGHKAGNYRHQGDHEWEAIFLSLRVTFVFVELV